MIVNIRSRLFSNVRAAIIAGTLQPNPINIGTKDLPGSPMAVMTRSTTKPARAMYPVPSIKARNINMVVNTGMKVITVFMPLPRPEVKIAINQLGIFQFNNK